MEIELRKLVLSIDSIKKNEVTQQNSSTKIYIKFYTILLGSF